MIKVVHKSRILLLGCGAVSRCLQELLYRHLIIDWSKVTLLDARMQTKAQNRFLAAGANFVQCQLAKDNFASVLSSYVGPQDLVIDLTGGVGTSDLLTWCQENDVLYANTSIEVWKKPDEIVPDPLNDTIFARYRDLYAYAHRWPKNSATAVIEHGANPGLVSHWVKYGLEYICNQINLRQIDIKQNDWSEANVNGYEKIGKALAEKNYARMAQLSGTKVIHISERDTQIEESRKPSEFLNTWSPAGLREESMAFSECTWGSHEINLPRDAMHLDHNGKFHLCIQRPALHNLIRSWVPETPIVGMLIPHGETFTIGNRLAIVENQRLVYRPTVCFVYRPSPQALESLLEYQSGRLQSFSDRLMGTQVFAGRDDLGTLLKGKFGCYWFGSRLAIEETRRLVGTQHNATVLQVASSLLGALVWLIQNPRKGLCVPGDLPSDQVLKVAGIYLGDPEIYKTNWTPSNSNSRENYSFQFEDFMVKDKTLEQSASHWH